MTARTKASLTPFLIAALAIAAVGLPLQPAHAGADQPIEAVSTASEPASLPPHFYRLANTRPGYETLCTEVEKLMAKPTIQPSCVQPQACVVRNLIPTGHPQFKQLEWQQLDVRSNWQIVRALTCFKFRLCNSVAALERRPEVVAYLSEVLEPARAEDKLILKNGVRDSNPIAAREAVRRSGRQRSAAVDARAVRRRIAGVSIEPSLGSGPSRGRAVAEGRRGSGQA